MNHPATLPGPDRVAMPDMAATVPTRAPRVDMYTFIHKALRQAMAQVLHGLGALDAREEQECKVVLDGVDRLLTLLRSHLQHENDFLHTAIEARHPGGARQTADDHAEHQEAIGNLEDEVRALRGVQADHRAPLALRLYRHLAAFVGENLTHMQIEETRGHATLWALYSDVELVDIHDRLLASLPPAELTETARWMAAALSVPELAALFSDLRGKAPPPAFEASLEVARAQLDERRWAQLARALGLAPAPGPMTA